MGRKQREPDLNTYSGRVAARLRDLRGEREISAEEMVARLGKAGVEVTVTTYYRYESGLRSIPPDLYPLLAQLLGKTVRSFLPPE